MTHCATCNKTIVGGGVRHGGATFCNAKCQQRCTWAPFLDKVPPDLLESEVRKVHRGPCPKCGGRGPVDLHRTHTIWSCVYFYYHSFADNLCCRRCGKKAQWLAFAKCLVMGWWSVHGVFITPFLLIANIKEIVKPPDPARPSDKLVSMLRGSLARQLAARGDGLGNAFASLGKPNPALRTTPSHPFETSTHSPFS